MCGGFPPVVLGPRCARCRCRLRRYSCDGGRNLALNPHIGERAGLSVSARPFVGELPADVGSVTGRMAGGGEAIAGSSAAEALGLLDGAGGVDSQDRRLAVVGVLEPTGAVPGLGSTVLYRAEHDQFPVRILYVLADPGIDVAGNAPLAQPGSTS